MAPDHPRIKEIVKALQRVVRRERIRFAGNVAYGLDLRGGYGAADFVSWYAGHSDVLRHWPLDAREVAVIDAYGWSRVDAYELALAAAAGCERIKVVPREDMLKVANG